MKSVAVIGAGIAGLRVAQLLEKKGHSVIVYEARERVGGRLHTVQSGPGFYEAGGEWIDADHSRVIGLLNEYGLEPEPTDPRPRWLHFCGDNAWSNDAWPVAAMATEALWQTVPDVRSGARSYKSLGDVLDDVCKEPLSRAYCEAVALSDEGTDSSQVDARAWAEFFEMYEERTSENEEMSAYRFPGGAQALCEEMAGTLKHPVEFRKSLQKVVSDSESVRLSFLDGSTSDSDACVLAIPPTCLKEVDVSSESKPWEQVVMSPTCKVVLEFDSPFWEELDWGGSLMSDLSVQQVWPGGRSGLCLLTCYVNGEKSRLVCGQDDPVRYALDSLARLFPGIERSFVGGTLHDWFSDPYSGGGFPVVPPGSGYRPPVVTTGDPRIVLAGDWTAHWMGFIEGALESAERAAEALTVG